MNTLIWGNIDKSLVYIPEDEALRLASLWQAIRTSETWADFIRLAGEEEFDQLIMDILEALGHEALFVSYKMGEDLRAYITDLYLPQPEDPFTTDIIPGFEEGEYLPIPAQEMVSWIPEELFDEMGEVKLHEDYGFIYYINPENQPLVDASLTAGGYQIKHHQELVERASGR